MARTIAGAVYARGGFPCDPYTAGQIAIDAAAIIDELDRLEAEHDKKERERAGQYAGPETGPEMYTRLSENPGANAPDVKASLDAGKMAADYHIGPG